MKNSKLLLILLMGLSLGLNAQTVTIGTQVWMTKNLNVSTFRNGDPIPEAKTDEEWKLAGENQQPAWCYYDNNPANGAKYGKLYNWYAVNDPRGLAPQGYHVPTDAEWTKLVNFLGLDAGKKMKSATGWNSKAGESKECPNCASWNAEYRRKVACHTCKDTRSVPAPKVTKSGNGTNTSGFSGLPGGYRGVDGPFYGVGDGGTWWCSTEHSAGTIWTRDLYYLNGTVARDYYGYEVGLSVRCLRN